MSNLYRKTAQAMQKSKVSKQETPRDRPPISRENENPVFDYRSDYGDIYKFNINKNKLIAMIGPKYPNMDHLFRTGEHYVYQIPAEPTPDEVNPVNDPVGARKTLYTEQLKTYAKKTSDYADNTRMVYTLVWSFCTVALQNAIKQLPGYATMETDRDLLGLWAAIVQFSSFGNLTHVSDEKKKMDSEIRFNNIRQRPNESIGEFYQRFTNELEAYEGMGNELNKVDMMDRIPVGERDEAQREADTRAETKRAMLFLAKIDKVIYGGLLDDLSNSSAAGRDEYPKTLSDAYGRVLTYKVSGKYISDIKSSTSAAFATTKAREEDEDLPFSSKKNTPEKRVKKSIKQLKDEIAAKAASTPQAGTKIKCYHCGEMGHLRTECPMISKAKRYLDRNKDSKDSARALVSQKAEDNEEDEEVVYVSTTEMALTSIDLSGQAILLDNQASVHIFRDEQLLSDLHEVQPITVLGIGGRIITNKAGKFEDIDNVYIQPNAIANILSFSMLAREKRVSYDCENDCFMLSFGDKMVKFTQDSGLYVWKNDSIVSVTTVSGNVKEFTNREVKGAKKARSWYAKLGPIHFRFGEAL